ncbi:uncharacterized protein LOC135689885 [Rhopilema esculentum]|uniref:uncharacterized protein LOC135689885 n=1 Tax=Rhopilema esculentum TaxID=499914 RepID=UPI0031E1693B|eukprot:gene3428-1798_t
MRKLLRRKKRASKEQPSMPRWCTGELHLDTAFKERTFADMERIGEANNNNSCLEEVIVVSGRHSGKSTSISALQEQVDNESRQNQSQYSTQINNFFSYFASGPLSTEEIAEARNMPKENAFKFRETSFMGGEEDGKQRIVAVTAKKIELKPVCNTMPTTAEETRTLEANYQCTQKALQSHTQSKKEFVKEIAEKNQFYHWRRTPGPENHYAGDIFDQQRLWSRDQSSTTQSHTQVISGQISRAISLPQVGLFGGSNSAYHYFEDTETQNKSSETGDTDSLAESITSSVMGNNDVRQGIENNCYAIDIYDQPKMNWLSKSDPLLNQTNDTENAFNHPGSPHAEMLQRRETSLRLVSDRWHLVEEGHKNRVNNAFVNESYEKGTDDDSSYGKKTLGEEQETPAIESGTKTTTLEGSANAESINIENRRKDLRESQHGKDIDIGCRKEAVRLDEGVCVDSAVVKHWNAVTSEFRKEGNSGQDSKRKLHPAQQDFGNKNETLASNAECQGIKYSMPNDDEVLSKKSQRSIRPPVCCETKESTCKCDQGHQNTVLDYESGRQNAAMEKCTIKSHRCESIEETSLIKKIEVEHTVQIHKFLKGDDGQERRVFSKTTQLKERIVKSNQQEEEWQLIPFAVPSDRKDVASFTNEEKNGVTNSGPEKENETVTTSFITERPSTQPRNSETRINVYEIELNMAKVVPKNYDVEAAMEPEGKGEDQLVTRTSSRMDRLSRLLGAIGKSKDEVKPPSGERTKQRRRTKRAKKRENLENIEKQKNDEKIKKEEQEANIKVTINDKKDIVEEPLDAKFIMEGVKDEEEKRKKEGIRSKSELDNAKRTIDELLKETNLTKRQKYSLMLMVCALDADMPPQFFEVIGKSSTFSTILRELVETKKDLLMFNMYKDCDELDQV